MKDAQLTILEQAKIGSLVPITKTISGQIDPAELFAKMSDFGKKKHSILLESGDIVPPYGVQSIGAINPCLNIVCRKKKFEINALNPLGEKFLVFLKDDFGFAKNVKFSLKKISGEIEESKKVVPENERIKKSTFFDVIRKVAFKFKPLFKPFTPFGGLFGVISYDFIDNFERLPKNEKDELNEPEIEMNYYDKLFLFDHKTKKTTLIANALLTDEKNAKEIYRSCIDGIEEMQELMEQFPFNPQRFKPIKTTIKSDVSKKEFEKKVEKIKSHILAGDVFQTVISRTIETEFNSEPLEIYKSLRQINPSPYMFYFNYSNGILVGASPEMNLKVENTKDKRICKLRPIAGTRKRGIINNAIDFDLDSKLEVELRLNEKEIAEHTMLVDLARNDIARVSKVGTRIVKDSFLVEKYSHVQHLVSTVQGELKNDFDALHAYLSVMNAGTLTGAPKVEAMKLIRKFERNARGLYGGSIAYLNPFGEFDSAIIIRSIFLKGKKAFVRSGAGIVFDSVPEQEFFETEKKAAACLQAIEMAGGVKFE